MNGRKHATTLPALCTLLSLVLLLVLIPKALPQDQNIDRYEKELKDIGERIDALQKLLRQEEKREATILSQLDRIGMRKELLRKEISLHHAKLRKTEAELQATQSRIGELQALLQREKENIIRVLTTLYKFGRISYAHLFLQVKDIDSLISGNKHLALLAHSQDRVIQSYSGALDELNTSQRDQVIRR